jgi:hypothetical protein
MDVSESPKTGQPVLLYFLDHPFKYEPIPERQFVGRVVLDSERKELLIRCYESRPDSVDESHSTSRLVKRNVEAELLWLCLYVIFLVTRSVPVFEAVTFPN